MPANTVYSSALGKFSAIVKTLGPRRHRYEGSEVLDDGTIQLRLLSRIYLSLHQVEVAALEWALDEDHRIEFGRYPDPISGCLDSDADLDRRAALAGQSDLLAPSVQSKKSSAKKAAAAAAKLLVKKKSAKKKTAKKK